MAASLALAIDPEVTHPALEILVTIEEENGLKGVDALSTSQLGMRSTKVFNLDMQNLGEVFVTSAGLAPVNARRSIEREVVPENSGKYIQINVRGMKGGHSGIYIHENRGNAIMVLNGLLKSFDPDIRLVSMEGGQAMNAIAGTAQAIVFLPTVVDFDTFQNEIDEYSKTLDPEWGTEFSLAEISQDDMERKVIVLNIHQRIVKAISQFPQGIRKMSDLVPGMVQTSSNIGVIRTEEGDINIEASVRSDLDNEVDEVFEDIRQVLSNAGFEVHMPVRSPGWRQAPESPLIQAVSKAYSVVTGKTSEVKGIHAALETGVVVSKLSNTLGGQAVEGVSFGPTIQDAHSPQEAVNVASVEIFYNQLKEAMKILVQQK